MFAARTSLLSTMDGGELGAGGSNDIALELNRIYADPMPAIRKHSSCIPGVGASGRSNSADHPSSTGAVVIAEDGSKHAGSNSNNNNKLVPVEKGEDFPLLPLDSGRTASSPHHRQSLGGTGGGGGTSSISAKQAFSPKSSNNNNGFEDDRLNTKYKLGWRRTLHNKRRQVADYSTIVALIGIAIMVLETELSMANVCQKTEFCSIFLKSFVSLSTLVLIALLFYYHYIEIEIFKVDNSVDDWRIAISPVRVVRILSELTICIVHPLPVDWNIKMYAISDSAVKEVRVSLDVVLGVPMFLRLYLLARLLLLHSRLFTDASSRSIGALNRITFNARFVLKTLMTMCPGTVLMTFILTMFIIGSWILRICETAHNPAYYNLLNSMWLVSITFLAVGYGDFAPETYCGRTVAVFSGFMGAGCTALVVAVVARKLELTRSEKHVHNFMMNTQLSKRLKDSAANVLRETWLIFKYSKLVARPSSAKIREHQRKFLAAIKNLRKVKLEQRKIAEQCHNLVDFPKVLMGISDAVVEARSMTVDSMGTLQRRLDAVEKDVLEVKAHLLSIQSGLLQMMADFREATAASQATQQLQLQLLQMRAIEQGGIVQSYDYSSPSLDIVPSALLVSPPDYQRLSDQSLSGSPMVVQQIPARYGDEQLRYGGAAAERPTTSPSKYPEPGWLRRHLAGSGGQIFRDQLGSRKRLEEGIDDDDDRTPLWSLAGSAQTVVQLPVAGRGVARATSAMEAVASLDAATDPALPQKQMPVFSSAVNVSLENPPAFQAEPVAGAAPLSSALRVDVGGEEKPPLRQSQQTPTTSTSAAATSPGSSSTPAAPSSSSSSSAAAAGSGRHPLRHKQHSIDQPSQQQGAQTKDSDIL